MMPAVSLVLTVAGLVCLAVQLQWVDAGRLNAARVAESRVALATMADREPHARRAPRASEAMAWRVHDSRAQALVGSQKFADADFVGAIAALERAVALDPLDVTSHDLLADALFRTGDVNGAADHWRAAGAGKLAQRRGTAALNAGDTPRALAYYRVFAEVDPTGVDGWLVLGDTYTTLGNLDAAAASYKKIVAGQPRVAVGYARLASLYYFRMGRTDLASEVLDAALANAPAAEFFMVRSQIAAAEQRYPQAETNAREALALEPGNGTYLLWLGDIFLTQKRYDEAVAQYTRAVEQSTNPSVAWFAPLRAGRALTAAGRFDAAVDAFETAVAASAAQKQPAASVAAHYVLLGEACVRADRTARARSAFTQALTLDPSNESAAKHLAALMAR